MISIFVNYSRDEIRKELKNKKTNYQVVEDASFEKIKELAESQNIFNESQDFFIFEFPKNKDEAKILGEDFLNNSINNFYFEYLTGISFLPKKAKVSILEKKEKPNKKDFGPNSFLLSDTLFSRGAQETWLVFNKLKKQIPIEELHGTFLWAIKTVVMYKNSDAQKTISPFVRSKITGSFSKQDESFVKDFYKKALNLGIRAHLGEIDFEKSFERLILELPR